MAAAALAALLVAAPPAARGAAVALQADAQHSGNAGNGGPALPLRRAWTARLDRYVGYPVVAQGKAFVVTAPPSQAPRLVALDLRTGRRVWQRDLGGRSPSDSAALAYDAGRLFVTRDVYPNADDSALLALSPADGRVLWETGQSLTLFDAVPPVAVDGVVYLGEAGSGGAGGISAWRQEDGARLWSVSTFLGGDGSVAAAGDVVMTGVGCPPHLFRVRRDGTPLSPTSSGCTSGGGTTPVVAGARALLLGDDEDAGVFDVASGARVAPLHSDYIPATAGGVDLLTEAHIPGESTFRGHTLIARAAAGGRVLWRFRGDGYLDSAPLVAGGSVFVGSGSGLVYAVDLRTGRVRSRADAGASVLPFSEGALVPALAADAGVLLVPARGRLVAFV